MLPCPSAPICLTQSELRLRPLIQRTYSPGPPPAHFLTFTCLNQEFINSHESNDDANKDIGRAGSSMREHEGDVQGLQCGCWG